MMTVNFRLICILRSQGMLFVPLSRLSSNDSCAFQQLRSDLQSLALGSVGVDLKADLAAIDVKIDDSAALGKFIDVTDGDDVCGLEAGQDLPHPRSLGFRDEQ